MDVDEKLETLMARYQAGDFTAARCSLLMAVFGIAASLPMLVVGMLSRETLARSRGLLHAVGLWGKQVLAIALISLGVLTLSHADRSVEAWLLDHSPAWLTALTTRF